MWPVNLLTKVTFHVVCAVKVLAKTPYNVADVNIGSTNAETRSWKWLVGGSTCLSVPELESVEFEGDDIEDVKAFCYLGDVNGQSKMPE